DIALFVPLLGVDAVEHGPQEGRPGGLAPLVGGLDDIQPLLQLQLPVIQAAEGGFHTNDFHGQGSSPFSSAANANRAASSASGPPWAFSWRRTRPVRESSPARSHRSRSC